MELSSNYLVLTILVWIDVVRGDSSLWNIWWNYEGISGPSMWGRMNNDWYMCTKGKNQSPIDIEPNILLFDPSLKHIVIDGDKLTIDPKYEKQILNQHLNETWACATSRNLRRLLPHKFVYHNADNIGTLTNYGSDLSFEVNETLEHNTANLSLGPLSYKYRISQIKVHFGSRNGTGSEHTVGGNHFDGEIHIVAYNSDVYTNLSQALKAPRGVAIIAAFLQLHKIPNQEFYLISNLSKILLYKGQRARLKNLSIKSLLPSIEHFITYEGSLTQPGCQESVTWIILNKPIYVNIEQLKALRNLRQRDITHPQVFMFDNRRPVMPLHRRSVRTNINFSRGCSMKQNMQYQRLNASLRKYF